MLFSRAPDWFLRMFLTVTTPASYPDSAIGFDHGQRRIGVNTKDVTAVVGLPLAMLDVPHRRDVAGNVFGLRRDGSQKVKMVALYFDLEEQTSINGQGRFMFKKIPYGDYVVQRRHERLKSEKTIAGKSSFESAIKNLKRKKGA